MARKPAVKLTASFERNLEAIEQFLSEAEAPGAFDALLDDLLETVIPSLERFPDMGRPFLRRPLRSVETTAAGAVLTAKLLELTPDADALRECVLNDYVVLYATTGSAIHLLAIKHQRQVSFDFRGRWED